MNKLAIYARALKARNQEEGGFTLLELIIVIAIIAILVAIAIPVFSGQKDNARLALTKTDARNIGMGVEKNSGESGDYPGMLADATAPAKILEMGLSKNNKFSNYEVSADGRSFSFLVTSTGDKDTYAVYDSALGGICASGFGPPVECNTSAGGPDSDGLISSSSCESSGSESEVLRDKLIAAVQADSAITGKTYADYTVEDIVALRPDLGIRTDQNLSAPGFTLVSEEIPEANFIYFVLAEIDGVADDAINAAIWTSYINSPEPFTISCLFSQLQEEPIEQAKLAGGIYSASIHTAAARGDFSLSTATGANISSMFENEGLPSDSAVGAAGGPWVVDVSGMAPGCSAVVAQITGTYVKVVSVSCHVD